MWTCLHLSCCALFHFVCLSFLGARVQQVEVFIFTRGHRDSTNYLPAPQLFATILFIYNTKKGKNQVS